MAFLPREETPGRKEVSGFRKGLNHAESCLQYVLSGEFMSSGTRTYQSHFS
jgi:hypothetical protein